MYEMIWLLIFYPTRYVADKELTFMVKKLIHKWSVLWMPDMTSNDEWEAYLIIKRVGVGVGVWCGVGMGVHATMTYWVYTYKPISHVSHS